MRRFGSWIALYAAILVESWIFGLLVELCLLLLDMIMRASEVMFWVLVILCGSGVLSLFFVLILAGANLAVYLSQKIEHSLKGRRYSVFGIIIAVQYVLSLIGAAVGIITGGDMVYFILRCVVMVVFGLAIWICGKDTVTKDGPPLTKRERLERKLKKLQDEE